MGAQPRAMRRYLDALFRLKDMMREVVQDTSGLCAYVRIRDANVPVASPVNP